jgi:Flp pilus assembly protein TadG
VEFALVLPLLVALLFTMIAAGSVLIDRLDLQSAARARVAW